MDINVELWIQGGIFLAAVTGLAVSTNRGNDKKRARIYERIDEVKGEMVSKEVCGIISEQMSSDITEIKTDVKVLLQMSGNKKG